MPFHPDEAIVSRFRQSIIDAKLIEVRFKRVKRDFDIEITSDEALPVLTSAEIDPSWASVLECSHEEPIIVRSSQREGVRLCRRIT